MNGTENKPPETGEELTIRGSCQLRKEVVTVNELIFTRKVTDVISTDVLVIGGGPAGVAAAIASARNGAKTMLVERCGFVGGMATAALVGPFMTCYDGKGEKQIIRGIYDELVNKLEDIGGAIHPSKIGWGTPHAAFIRIGHDHVTPFDSELLKLVAEEMLVESGVRLLYYTQFIDCEVESGRIASVIVAKKDGLSAINAKVYIDCSGDADVAEKANVPVVKGRIKDGAMQPATMFFKVCNVDSEKVYEEINKNRDLMDDFFAGAFCWAIAEGKKNGEWTITRDELGTYETHNKGEWRLNTTRMLHVDGTKSEDLTRASIEGRKQVQQVYRFLRKRIPGFENVKMLETGSVVGIRETRHIVGKYVMEKEDILNANNFEDNILLCSNAIDIHSDSDGGGEYKVIDSWYGIPYRSLLPNNCDNLLVAGRTISATSEAASAFRVMPCCFGIGQAAGTAAALCLKENVNPEDVSIEELQKTLISQDVFLNKWEHHKI